MSPATRLAPTRTLFAISNIFVCLFSFTPPPCAKHFRWSHFALQAQKSLRGVPGLRSLGPLGAPEHESTADSPGLGCLCATFFFGRFDRTLGLGLVVTKRSRGSMGPSTTTCVDSPNTSRRKYPDIFRGRGAQRPLQARFFCSLYPTGQSSQF
jgi:hypothetical protein